MKLPFPLPVRFLADKLGLDARDFAAGWANGLARWKSWQASVAAAAGPRETWRIPASPFPEGSVSAAASAAAIAYMLERQGHG